MHCRGERREIFGGRGGNHGGRYKQGGEAGLDEAVSAFGMRGRVTLESVPETVRSPVVCPLPSPTASASCACYSWRHSCVDARVCNRPCTHWLLRHALPVTPPPPSRPFRQQSDPWFCHNRVCARSCNQPQPSLFAAASAGDHNSSGLNSRRQDIAHT